MKLTVKIFSLILAINMLFAVAPSVSCAMLEKDEVEVATTFSGISVSDSDIDVMIIGRIIGSFREVSIGVGALMLMVIALIFMILSAEKKAEYKKYLVPLVVGIIVVMATTTIISIIWSII